MNKFIQLFDANKMKDLKSLFLLNPELNYLNHGSFGACPEPVFNEYQKWQLELEKSPVHFMLERAPILLKEARERLAKYIGCFAEDLVYTTNPSYAINIIAKSIDLKAGDEILSTDLEYGAMDRTWKYYCKQKGAKYIRQKIQLPISNKEQIVNEIFNGYTNKTKALFISHITSTTALILPVKEICDRAKELGLMTIVDGAHVPGHIPLKINDLNADIYTGACHKWMLSPKGASFLYVNKKLQDLFDPLVISWGYESDDPSDSKFIDYHQYQGTRDIAAFLTVPRAIDFLDENNWLEVSLNCKKLVLDNYESLCGVLGSLPICPLNSDFLGQMCSAPIKSNNEIKLKEVLFNKYKIEIPLMKSDDQLFIRMSVQCYNSQKDIDCLFNVLEELNKSSDLIH